MKILTKSKNQNVVQLTDSELAALLTPSIKIETADRDNDGNKFSDMSPEDFFHLLQFHSHCATTGKIDPDKFKIIFRDIFSYLAAHNIPVAQFADNIPHFDSNFGTYTCIAQLIQSVAKENHTEPLAVAEIIFKYFKEVNIFKYFKEVNK